MTVFLWGCKPDTSIEILKDGASLQVIKDKETKELITKAFDSKSEVVFKRRPDFEYVIKVGNGEKAQEWLYSSMGVITEKDAGSTLYRVDLQPSQILKQSSK